MYQQPPTLPTTNGHRSTKTPRGDHRGPGTVSASLPAQRLIYPVRESARIHYAPAWFGLGLAATVMGMLGLQRYGRPAAASLGALGLAGLVHMMVSEPGRPTLESVTLRLPTLPAGLDGLRIGQISDSHLGMPHAARNLAWAVAQMRRAQPDLVVLTGDLVSHRRAISRLPALLRGLRAPLGVYAVPGNHDYWEGLADQRAALARANIPLLLNEHRRLRWNGADLWLVGVDDIWAGRPDLAAALEGVPADAFTLLLCHAPDAADEAARHGIAVQLSGHTHGGHLRLPLLGPFSRPRFGLRYVMGSYQVGTMALYVSRGLGGLPLRLFCRPEATIFTLRCDRG
jgi:predicted MPP superfamily phosphohydrolase